MGTLQNQTREYAAFISYAHADEAMAARLHKALETYPVPKHLRAQGKTTKPVFRDVAELTAAHSLSEKIRDAVKGSRVLIVLCSPAAKASHWVNEEIRLFRELHGDAAILSAITEGTPETAFPAALVEGGREPLAAALGADKAGFKLGVTQLAAGMLGTGLDDLIQRGAKRRNRIMGAGLAASLALSGVMGFTAFQAVEARNEAQTARAEAEGLVEYMIKDLKFKLEPVGRLDLLQGIGDKAVEYYDKQDIKSLPDDSLTRQAAARQVLAQVHMDAGRMEDAQREIEAAAALTREVLARNPDDTDAIFAHAQSEYWVGAYYFDQPGKLVAVEKPWREYDRLAQVLYQKDPTNFEWVMEAGHGRGNLAILARESYSQDMARYALTYYSEAIEYFEEAMGLQPNSKSVSQALADNMSGKANIILALSDAKTTRSFYLDYLTFLKNLAEKYPKDMGLVSSFYVSQLDYYNGNFIDLNQSNKEAVATALSQIHALTQHDTENLQYKENFLHAISNLFNNFEHDELKLRKRQAETLLKEIPYDSGINVTFYKSMMRILDVKIDILNNKNIAAEKTLSELGNIYLNLEQPSIDDWKVLYSIYLMHENIGGRDETRLFAQAFLDTINERSNLKYPTIIYRKAQAHAILGNCDAVIPLAESLQARGYLDDVNYKLLSCSDD